MAESLLGSKDSLIQKAALLRITTKTLANSLQNGSFKSLYHGQGIEFSGVREYLRGDDVRRAFIDEFEGTLARRHL